MTATKMLTSKAAKVLTTRIVTMEKDDDEDEYDDVQYNEDEEVEGEED